jgi:hypothetical protein
MSLTCIYIKNHNQNNINKNNEFLTRLSSKNGFTFTILPTENNHRPDLMLYNAPDFNKPVVADVCITSLHAQSQWQRLHPYRLLMRANWTRSWNSQKGEINQI